MKPIVRLSVPLLSTLALFCASCVETKNSYSLAGLFPVPKLNQASRESSRPSSAKSEASTTSDNQTESVTQMISTQPLMQVKARYRWSDPAAEKIWESCIQDSVRLSTKPRIENVDTVQSEKMLEAFGIRYMPNAYARYQETRAKALELEQTVVNTFPRGQASDPTGGEMFGKAAKRLAIAVAKMFREHDELCFFLLLHQAGIFPETVLAKYDTSPISISLDLKEDAWPDDTPESLPALSPEDATFGTKHMPETFSALQNLSSLFEDGAKQYRELRQTALALDAVRAHRNLDLLRTRLEEIKKEWEAQRVALSVLRMKHALGEENTSTISDIDRKSAFDIQSYAKSIALKPYFVSHSKTTDTTIILPSGVPMEMVWCPAGSFIMGGPGKEKSSFDATQHQVTIGQGFLMAKYEITQKQWLSMMGYKPWEVPRRPVPGQLDEPAFSPKHEGADLPVHHVSWTEAVEFCRKAGNGLLLPTEEQWESACRAGSTGPYGGTGNLDEMGWYEENSRSRPHPGGEKLPNAWGLYDMHGNVLEWCLNQSDNGRRVQRGGGWQSSYDKCRSYSFAAANQQVANPSFGFRPCCPAEIK